MGKRLKVADMHNQGGAGGRPRARRRPRATTGLVTDADDACALTRADIRARPTPQHLIGPELPGLTRAATSAGSSAVQDRQVEPAQPRGIGEHVELDAPPTPDGEAHDRDRPSPEPPRRPRRNAPQGNLFVLIGGEWKDRLAPLGIDPRHVVLLRHVAAAEGQSQQALGRAMQIPPVAWWRWSTSWNEGGYSSGVPV